MSAERVIANTLRLAQADLDAATNPLKSLLKQIEHLAAYATTYRYATTSGNIKPSPDDNTLQADMASVNAALSAAATAFGVDLSKQDQPARTAKAPR